MLSLIEDFCSFVKTSPTSWHAVKQAGYRLALKDFHPLEEETPWNLQEEKKYFVSRGGSIAAFCLPKKPPSQILLMAAHTDSPALKVKPCPDVQKQGMSLLEVETYGSPILHSWLNRDLALAGRIFVTNSREEIAQHLVFLDDALMVIPELAIHLQREINEKGPLTNKQEHMMPLISLQGSFSLEALLRRYVSFSSLLSFDLFAVPVEPPRFLGLNSEMLASYRLDNLTSVHAAISAIASYEDSSILPLAVFWDHEEIGSLSWEGAFSSFLNDLLLRIQAFYKMSTEDFLILKRKSLALSLDMAHGVNPMHENKYDPNHQPLLGKGIVLKTNAQMRYASSAETQALAKHIADKAHVKVQSFAMRSDMPCGSTVGPAIAAMTGIATVDLGCPQFSMHSSREVLAVQDYLDLVAFLNQALKP